jgi:Phage head-tail joining protein
MAASRAPAIGRLRNLATLYHWTDEPTRGGQALPRYRRIGQEWIGIDPARGSVEWSGAAVTEAASGTDTFWMRFRDGLDTETVIEARGQRWRVLRVLPDDRRRFLSLSVERYGDQDLIGVEPPAAGGGAWDDGSRWDADGARWDAAP